MSRILASDSGLAKHHRIPRAGVSKLEDTFVSALFPQGEVPIKQVPFIEVTLCAMNLSIVNKISLQRTEERDAQSNNEIECYHS